MRTSAYCAVHLYACIDSVERDGQGAPAPFANAASKAPRTLGCKPLKPEQMQVVFWSVGWDVFAVLATGFVLRGPTSCVRLRQSWRSPTSRAGLIYPHRRHKRPGCKLLVQCLTYNDITFWDNATKVHNNNIPGVRPLMLASPDYFFRVK